MKIPKIPGTVKKFFASLYTNFFFEKIDHNGMFFRSPCRSIPFMERGIVQISFTVPYSKPTQFWETGKYLSYLSLQYFLSSFPFNGQATIYFHFFPVFVHNGYRKYQHIGKGVKGHVRFSCIINEQAYFCRMPFYPQFLL